MTLPADPCDVVSPITEAIDMTLLFATQDLDV